MIKKCPTGWLTGSVDQAEFSVRDYPRTLSGSTQIHCNGVVTDVKWKRTANTLKVWTDGKMEIYEITGNYLRKSFTDQYWKRGRFVASVEKKFQDSSRTSNASRSVKSQMPGKVVKVLLKNGDRVEAGQTVLILEAMKMENEIKAVSPGLLDSLQVTEGKTVESGVELFKIKNEAAT